MNCLWTDGSSGKSGKIGWAVVGVINGEQVRFCGFGDGTNQRAELYAVLYAIMEIDIGESLLVISDSMYAIKSCTEWRADWIANDYVSYRGVPVANQDIIKEIHKEMDGRDVTFEHVKGHSGDEGNEFADSLAFAARKKAEGFDIDLDKYLNYSGFETNN